MNTRAFTLALVIALVAVFMVYTYIEDQRTELKQAVNKMELYQDEVRFNLFHEKKRKDLKILSALNDFIKPNPYFVYYMFKDTIHVDDYGSIKETLFKFPNILWYQKVKPYSYSYNSHAK